MKKKPEILYWNNMMLVRISDCSKAFAKWLSGQTLPYVDKNSKPSDWCYYWDYFRYINKLPIID
jgi:hypothetical protein